MRVPIIYPTSKGFGLLPKSANLISMQRLTGKLGGRDGTFVLQGKETADKGVKEVLKATLKRV